MGNTRFPYICLIQALISSSPHNQLPSHQVLTSNQILILPPTCMHMLSLDQKKSPFFREMLTYYLHLNLR